MYLKSLFAVIALAIGITTSLLHAQIAVTDRNISGSFPLVQDKKAVDIFIDSTDAEVVKIAATCFTNDIALVTGVKAGIQTNTKIRSANVVIIGTLGHSFLIDQLDKSSKLTLGRVRGKWETFSISVIDHPMKGIDKALVIVGSDRRGTAFGVFELSRMMGVSPWYWWADVMPRHTDELYISGTSMEGPPSVKYRGIFLNDEDWGLQPWAANKMDTSIKDIGPKTYTKIFELLLRLKANSIWPAMHPCTKAFYHYPDNPKTADNYAIVVGSSHCEPILRNNVFEWTENFEHEYGVKPGEYRYDTNKEQVYRYWEDRAKQSASYESIYTVGMRGVHDGNMVGPSAKEERVKLLDTIIHDQRTLLAKTLNKPVNEISQIFCPYKEVLELYRGGLKLPDDVTMVWADDNHGYVRQLSNPEEQKRSGSSGVYYHVSYWGAPHDYLWLSSISPSLISYELTKSYQYGASKLWILNVGDIKPTELETQFTMDLAWNINEWTPEKAYKYVETWASDIFGKEYGPVIAKIKSEYYRLSQCGKPEHLGMLKFDETTYDERVRDYQVISDQAEEIGNKIPQQLKDAYFQLILYPVRGACLMNQKFVYARKSALAADKDEKKAIEYAVSAKKAFDQIKYLTKVYNQDISGGKWEGMMSWHPRDLQVFYMPKVAPVASDFVKDRVYNITTRAEYIDSIQGASASSKSNSTETKTIIAAADFSNKNETNGSTIEIFPGLGLGGNGISIMPFTTPSIRMEDISKATYVEYHTNLTSGIKTITVKCLPTMGICKGRSLRYGISVNNDMTQVIEVNSQDDKTWKYNVIRGFSIGNSNHNVVNNGEATIRIYPLDPGLVINRIEISL